MLTAVNDATSATTALSRGAFDYLMKPVNIDELLYKIEDAYTRKKLNERQNQDTKI
jgi:DNA-binding NtrC family response regulator